MYKSYMAAGDLKSGLSAFSASVLTQCTIFPRPDLEPLYLPSLVPHAKIIPTTLGLWGAMGGSQDFLHAGTTTLATELETQPRFTYFLNSVFLCTQGWPHTCGPPASAS